MRVRRYEVTVDEFRYECGDAYSLLLFTCFHRDGMVLAIHVGNLWLVRRLDAMRASQGTSPPYATRGCTGYGEYWIVKNICTFVFYTKLTLFFLFCSPGYCMKLNFHQKHNDLVFHEQDPMWSTVNLRKIQMQLPMTPSWTIDRYWHPMNLVPTIPFE